MEDSSAFLPNDVQEVIAQTQLHCDGKVTTTDPGQAPEGFGAVKLHIPRRSSRKVKNKEDKIGRASCRERV